MLRVKALLLLLLLLARGRGRGNLKDYIEEGILLNNQPQKLKLLPGPAGSPVQLKEELSARQRKTSFNNRTEGARVTSEKETVALFARSLVRPAVARFSNFTVSAIRDSHALGRWLINSTAPFAILFHAATIKRRRRNR